MLETFRKHHKIMMIFIAAIVIVAFTFLYNPSRDLLSTRGAVVATVGGQDLTQEDADQMGREFRMAQELGMMAWQGGSRDYEQIMNDPMVKFQGVSAIVDETKPRGRDEQDLDPLLNLAIVRQECARLGIDADREDVEKAIKTLGAFKENGTFDDTKLNAFLDSGRHGDRGATESKLLAVVKDALLYQRLGALVGGSFTPSPAEIDHFYATQNVRTTVLTALVEKKNHENQTVTDEDIKKYYDEEKVKQDAVKPDDKEKKPGADASLLTEEKRTVKYILVSAPKLDPAPTAPAPLRLAPVLEDVSKLPEDQKKAREDAHKAEMDKYNAEKAEHDKKTEQHTKDLADHQKKVKENEEARKKWLQNLSDFSVALGNAETRGSKSFEEVAKAYSLEVKTATFARTAAPDDLKAATVSPTPTPGQPPQGPSFDPVAAIFSTDKGREDITSPQDQSSFCLFVVDAIEAPAMKPMEEVKTAISEKLKKDKIAAALKAAGDDARTKTLEALKAGKPFKEAATAGGLTAVEVPAYSSRKPIPEGTANSGVIQSTAAKLNKGDLSEAVEVPEGLLFVYVEKKELPNDPKMAEQKKNMVTGQTVKATDSPLFRAWFHNRRSTAIAVAQ